MDERIKSEYRKIYSELCSLIVLFAACSLLIKAILLDDPREVITETIIIIGAPLYLFIRQLMLGINPYDAERKGKNTGRKLFFTSLLGAFVGMFAVNLAQDRGAINVSLVLNFVIFIAVYTLVYVLARVLTRRNADRKAAKYEDD